MRVHKKMEVLMGIKHENAMGHWEKAGSVLEFMHSIRMLRLSLCESSSSQRIKLLQAQQGTAWPSAVLGFSGPP